MNIEKYGFNPQTIEEKTSAIPARITAVYRDLFEVVCEHGTSLARLKSSEYVPNDKTYPCTGDFVLLDWQENGESRIIKTLPRKSYFSRVNPASKTRKEQAVAANFDYIFIVQSLDRDFNLARLERYLTLAWQSGAIPVIILSKADLIEDHVVQMRAVKSIAIDTDIIALSSKTGAGLEQISSYLQEGKTIVFLGSSGVGKSSLLNKLADEQLMATNSISKKDGRGQHTTSHRQLFMLKNGTMIIDTPGMRELGMLEVSQGLEQSFTDVEQYFDFCKFKDCSHKSEPGCAVKEALRNGELTHKRWESYLKLKIESKIYGDKAEYQRDKQQLHKEVSKLQKQKRTTDYRHNACAESFTCVVCGTLVMPENAGSQHRNHCPACLSSLHVDNKPGDRASLCQATMDAIGVWVRNDGEWALIHRCRSCGILSSNRIAADDNVTLLMSIAMRPLANPPFPLTHIQRPV